MARRLLRTFIRFLFWLLTDTNISGTENIPSTGACILTINHLGILDAPLVFILLERDDATGLVGLTHKKNPILRWLVNIMDGIWIDRENPDIHALKVARGYLKKEWILGIAPEGTRSDTHALIEGKSGVAFLADVPGIVLSGQHAVDEAVKRTLPARHQHAQRLRVTRLGRVQEFFVSQAWPRQLLH